MLGLQVGINLQKQFAVVAVSNPFCQRETVNARLKALCNEIIAKVVMGEPFALCRLASTVEAPLAFRNLANTVCGLRVVFVLELPK
jgi:hypothetical protein